MSKGLLKINEKHVSLETDDGQGGSAPWRRDSDREHLHPNHRLSLPSAIGWVVTQAIARGVNEITIEVNLPPKYNTEDGICG